MKINKIYLSVWKNIISNKELQNKNSNVKFIEIKSNKELDKLI